MSGGVDLTQSQLVMIPIVEDVHQVGVERMDVLKLWELGQNDGQLLVEARLSELDLSHVEGSDSADLEMSVNDGRSLALSLGQDDVGEVRSRRHDRNLLEVVVRHLLCWIADLKFRLIICETGSTFCSFSLTLIDEWSLAYSLLEFS